MLRSPLRRKTPLRSRKPISPGAARLRRSRLAPISAKRRAGLSAWAEVKRQLRARSGGRCEIRVPGVCTGRARDAHHVKRRSQSGKHELDFLRHVCRPCHRHVHNNVAWAIVNGFLTSRKGAA